MTTVQQKQKLIYIRDLSHQVTKLEPNRAKLLAAKHIHLRMWVIQQTPAQTR